MTTTTTKKSRAERFDPAIEPDPNKPSVVSHKIVHDLLQDQLGFQGIIVTDAMDMRGLTSAFGPGPEGVAKANLEAIYQSLRIP